MINFIIGFIVGGMLMMCAIGLMSCQKDKKPRNKVRFFITKSALFSSETYTLWLKKPKLSINKSYFYSNSKEGNACVIAHNKFIEDYNINLNDFVDMKEGEIREVFLNLED